MDLLDNRTSQPGGKEKEQKVVEVNSLRVVEKGEGLVSFRSGKGESRDSCSYR